MATAQHPKSAAARASLTHPVIDSGGSVVVSLPGMMPMAGVGTSNIGFRRVRSARAS
jgi:hypothetical protein